LVEKQTKLHQLILPRLAVPKMRLPLLLVSGALAYLNGVLALQPLTPMRHRTLRLASNQWPRSPRSSMTMVAALPAPSDVLVNARSTLFNAVRLSSAALQNTNPRTLAVFAAGVRRWCSSTRCSMSSVEEEEAEKPRPRSHDREATN
jgi:hypothetical protein